MEIGMSKPRVRISGAMPIDMKNHFRDAVEFYANYLMSPQLVKNLNIHLKYKRELDDETVGECEVLSESMNARHFKITITPMSNNKMNRVMLFQTLAHEMIHVKQYATKQLKYMSRSAEKIKWKGRYINEDKVKYEKLPWEKEAFLKESSLFSEYVCYSDSFDYFFG
jgi:hypothetical protein